MARDQLLIRFATAFNTAGQRDGAVDAFAFVESLYADKRRRYHTLDHVAACVDELDRLDAPHVNRAEMTLALVFHDAVLDPFSHANEAVSATLARAYLPGPVGARIADMIIATDHHTTAWTAEERYVADIDLAILGADEKTYRQYAEAIRQEYHFFSDEVYRNGRTACLRSFLDRELLFNNRSFAERYEDRARRNMAAEIVRLDRS